MRLPGAKTLFLSTKNAMSIFCLTIYSTLLANSHHQSKTIYILTTCSN